MSTLYMYAFSSVGGECHTAFIPGEAYKGFIPLILIPSCARDIAEKTLTYVNENQNRKLNSLGYWLKKI